MTRFLVLAFTIFLACACGGSRPDTRALLIAAENGDIAALREQLERGAGADDVLNVGDRTPLCLAARAGQSEAVRILLGAGADPRAEHQGANVKLETLSFRANLKGIQADPKLSGTIRKQDGTTVDLRSLPLNDTEYERILSMLDAELARKPAK